MQTKVVNKERSKLLYKKKREKIYNAWLSKKQLNDLKLNKKKENFFQKNKKSENFYKKKIFLNI